MLACNIPVFHLKSFHRRQTGTWRVKRDRECARCKECFAVCFPFNHSLPGRKQPSHPYTAVHPEPHLTKDLNTAFCPDLVQPDPALLLLFSWVQRNNFFSSNLHGFLSPSPFTLSPHIPSVTWRGNNVTCNHNRGTCCTLQRDALLTILPFPSLLLL